MWHTFFYVLSFLTDYRAVADALRVGFTLGLIDALVVSVVVGSLSFRGRKTSRNGGLRLVVSKPRRVISFVQI